MSSLLKSCPNLMFVSGNQPTPLMPQLKATDVTAWTGSMAVSWRSVIPHPHFCIAPRLIIIAGRE
ncbi:MAG: hypothetical protein HYT77_02350 [Deltaproteobacteria bacterium]|nr:hypothetical protein [Deltaproteobacteria bacterium]